MKENPSRGEYLTGLRTGRGAGPHGKRSSDRYNVELEAIAADQAAGEEEEEAVSTDQSFKHVVRERMSQTGEKYSRARRCLLQSAIADPGSALREVVAYLDLHPEVVTEMERMTPRNGT